MSNEPIELLSRTAALLAEAVGLRTATGLVVEQITRSLSAKMSFIALRRKDNSVADIIATHGLGATEFRRLESRITKSSLWRILRLSSPIAIDDLRRDAVLNFLGFGTGAGTLIAVPVMLRGSVAGLIAVGFAVDKKIDEELIIKLLTAIAAMVAQTIRVEKTVSEESRHLIAENSRLKHELREKYDLSHLIGNSSPMRKVYDQAAQVARSSSAVLLRGEDGAGKEFVAASIHYNSLRSKRPFINLNCAALPETQIERELFGSESAIQSPSEQKKGSLELADGGTLFLDEIGGLSLQTQRKLLTAIQEHEFERVGGTATIRFNVRLIAASTKNLELAIENGLFRSDLFERLNVFTIFLPPLRERRADILLLAEHFLDKYEREHKKAVRRISTSAIDMLSAYHFPGNVRELENVIERAVLACDSNVIHAHHLPPTLQTAEVSDTVTRVTLASAVEAFESDLILDTLKSTRGNVAKAAIMLDSTERILGYKIKKFSINPRRFRRQLPQKKDL